MKGCCNPIIEPYEFEIDDKSIIVSNIKNNLKIPIQPTADIDLLKDKVICEYKRIISDLERGRTPTLDFLLEEISAIDLNTEIDNREFIISYYLNNDL